MHRQPPTQSRGGRGVGFAPLAQRESDPIQPGDDVSQRWENATATEDFRNRIQNIFRNTAPIVGEDDEEEDDDGMLHARPRRSAPAYAPVRNVIPEERFEETGIAELAGPPIEYYAPHHTRAPSALSKASDTRTETSYMGSEPGGKYLQYAPRVVSVEVDGSDTNDTPGKLPNYKPFVLRHTFLWSLFLTTIALLALMIVLVNILPDAVQNQSTNLIARNSSLVRSRSSNGTLQARFVSNNLSRRRNDNSTASNAGSQASDARETSTSSSITSTATITTDRLGLSEVLPDLGSATSTAIPTSTANTNTLVGDTMVISHKSQTQQSSQSDGYPSLTTASETTEIAPTTVTTSTRAHGESVSRTYDISSSLLTQSASKPGSGGDGDGAGNDKTRSGGGPQQPTTQKSSSANSVSTSYSSTSLSSGNGPGHVTSKTRDSATKVEPTQSTASTQRTDQTNPLSISTATTSESQASSSQGGGSVTVSSTTSTGNDGTSHTTTHHPLTTCTVDVTSTQVQWITVPFLTIDLGLGSKKRSGGTRFSIADRRAHICDETITVSHIVTVVSTTALTTITIGRGGGQATSGTSAFSTSTLAEVTSTGALSSTSSTRSMASDASEWTSSLTSQSHVSETYTTTVAGGVTQIDTTSGDGAATSTSNSAASTVGTTVIDSGASGGSQITVPNTATAVETLTSGVTQTDITTALTTESSTRGSQGSVGSATEVLPATSVMTTTSLTMVATKVENTSILGGAKTITSNSNTTVNSQPTQQYDTDHNSFPQSTSHLFTPVTTVLRVIESTTIISSMVLTVTPTASETNSAGVMGHGAVFMTTVPITSKMFVTRLRTQAVIYGQLTDTSDRAQETFTLELTNSNGDPTATVTITGYGYLTTQTLTGSGGFPTATVTNKVVKLPLTTTFTGSDGGVSVKTYYEETVTTTLFNDGTPTATQVLEITQTPEVTTEYDDNGVPTKTFTRMVADGTSTSTSIVVATITNAPNASTAEQDKYIPVPISTGSYFIGFLLPTLLAIALSIPIRILDQTTKLYQPFSAMTVAYGARTSDSLCLKTTGLWGLISGFMSPRTGNWLLVVTGLLVITSSTLVALSTEAMQLTVQTSTCEYLNNTTIASCPTSLSVSSGPARSSIGVICVMVLLIAITIWALWRRRMGTCNNQPWSMFDIGRLAKHEEILQLVKNLDTRQSGVTRQQAIAIFGNRRFVLGQWKDETGRWNYGVRIKNDAGDFPMKKKRCLRSRNSVMPFFSLSLAGRALFLLLLLGLALTILLYRNTGGAFQRFMDSGVFGGRFILTGAGVIVSLIWWTFFTCE